MRTLFRPILAYWTLVAACASAAMLGAAHAFETIGGLAPCHLCLYQRDAYWASLSVGIVGFALGYMRLAWASWAAVALLAALFALGAGVAAYHAGVEWRWWTGPASCTGGGAIDRGALTAFLGGAKARPPQCDVAPWRLLGVSMAGYNALISLALAGISVWALNARSAHD